ncbi:MAG: bifunctional DNA-binding transcriptional regulator/O6-methylguanine-DNA methyltransferase Ada [Thermomicrobiales bacterium]|nr:bifunctional DNA-binding transcriptional regulator/O6-methylguanine-DNA methyltransferase Ada [Thermomicrobiales bacterium]
MEQETTDQERWQAVQERDHRAENTFWFGVTTTRIFCRPGCPARTPQRENVQFFGTVREALVSGYRPCKRCKPLAASLADEQAAVIGDACQKIVAANTPVRLGDLAADAGMSEAHFQKLFRKVVGLSPAQFSRAVREQRLHQQLPMAENVLGAALDAGYASNSQLYAEAPEALGMTPGAFRNKGEGETIRYAVVDTWLGPTLVAATERGICRLQFGDDIQEMIALFERNFANATILPADDRFKELLDQAISALGSPEALKLPLDVRGTAFQIKVWHALRQIPFGQTISYGELARRIGQPTASRAVATACGSNDVAVLIPCHRVIGKDGSLTGYRWGTERKREILAREQTS